MQARTLGCSALAALLVASVAAAQSTPQTQPTQPSASATQQAIPAQELYHVHFAKAAPGKLNELISAYQQAPVPAGEPGPPLILRHLQGDDWDLLVLTPLGPEETLKPTASAEEQKSVARMRGLRTQHGDTFTSGPAWAELRAALLGGAATAAASVAASASGATGATGTSGSATGGSTAGGAAASSSAVPAGTIYTVTTYRSLPGHRDQLAATLQRVAALFPDRRTILQHVEGAPWEFVLIQRYDSWNALGEEEAAPPERLRSQGFANSEAIGLELRQHAAEHRDTIARLVR